MPSSLFSSISFPAATDCGLAVQHFCKSCSLVLADGHSSCLASTSLRAAIIEMLAARQEAGVRVFLPLVLSLPSVSLWRPALDGPKAIRVRRVLRKRGTGARKGVQIRDGSIIFPLSSCFVIHSGFRFKRACQRQALSYFVW